MGTVIFLSPHLDDAVFSCAGMIQQMIRTGKRVLVVTFFTSGYDGYDQRRTEDIAAVSFLGASVLHLGQTDAPYRIPAYLTFREIIFGWHPQDELTLASTLQLLEGLCEREQPESIFAPLGVGGHVDHRIVHESVKRLSWPASLYFYEDRPYAYAQGAAELRLRELKYDAPPVNVPALLKTFRQLPHVRKYLPAGVERKACEILLTNPLAGNPGNQSGITLLLSCAGDDVRKSHHAASFYVSQFPDFCGSLQRLQKLDLRHSVWLSNPDQRTERYWRLPA